MLPLDLESLFLDSSMTMMVYLKGHHLFEYYFGVANSRDAANDFDD